MQRVLKYFSASMVVLVTLIGSSHLVGCNTTEGAGKDIQNTGEAIKDAAHDAK